LQSGDVGGEDGQKPTMVEFPIGGDDWTWDGDNKMVPSSVQFHPQLSLFNGEYHLQKLKEAYGITSCLGGRSLEEDENQNATESQQAIQLAQELAEVMKDETLKSETEESKWYPIWILSTNEFDNESSSATTSTRRSRRSRTRGGPS
jgi:hypothetical protein